MQFKELGSLFSGVNGFENLVSGEFNRFGSISDMINIDKEQLDKAFKIGADGISEYTSAQIEAKAAAMGLKDSLKSELVALGQDATLTNKSATGKLTWSNALKDTKIDVEELGDALTKSGKISLDDIEFLNQAKGTDNYKNRLKGVIESVDGLGDSFIDLGDKGTKAGTSIGQVFTGLIGTLKPMLPYIACIAAASAALYALYKYANRFNDSMDKAQESLSAYQTTTSEIESLTSELEKAQQRIEELESKDSLSIVEEEELNKLREGNIELQRQIDLKDQLAKEQSEEAKKEAQDVLNLKATNDLTKKSSYYSNVRGDDVVTYEQTDILTATRNEIDALEELKQKRKELNEEYSLEDTTDERKKSINAEIKSIDAEISTYESAINSQIDSLSAIKDSFKGTDTYDTIVQLINDFVNIDLSDTEKEFKNIESFFNSSSNRNYIKDQLKEAHEEGRDLEQELNRIGFSLEDLGVENVSTLSRYFDDTKVSVEEAKKSVQDYVSTISDIEKATDSEDQDKSWSTASEAYQTAKELLAEGKTGTDNFQSMASFLNPEAVKKYIDEGVEYTADAYQKAFEDIKTTADRWFGEDETASMENFVNDFKNSGLFDVSTDDMGLWDIETNFKTTAEAANEFGISVEAVETMLESLEAYGYDFSEITFSTKGIKEYETVLNGLHGIYDALSEGSSKDRLGNLLSGLDTEFDNYKNDLDSLSETQIVKIKFEYDLATIQQKIDELQRVADEGGDSQSWAELNAAKRSYREKSEARDGNDIENDINYQQVSSTIAALQDQMIGAKDEQKAQIQEQISNLYDLQNAISDAFADSGLSWEEFIGTEEYQNAIQGLITSADDAKEIIAKALGIDVEDIVIKADVDVSDAESKIDGVLSNDGKTITMNIDASTEQIQNQINNLQEGQRLLFTAEVDGEPKGIAAFKDQNGVIKYAAEDNGVYYYLNEVENEDGTISYALGDYPTEIPSAEQEIIRQPNNENIKTVPTITQWVKRVFFGDSDDNFASGTMLSVAHADGTAYNVLNTKPISAFAGGNVSLSKNQRALVNEEYINGHSESIVRDGIWRLIPGGAHLENLKKGDIIFSAQQTEDLLNHGRTPGHARTYASGTMLSPAFRLGTGANASSVSSSNSSSSSSSSSDSADDFKETLDEIEILLEEFERDISNLDTIAQGAYRSWAERNSALSQEMSKVTEEISIQQQAYDKYIEKAKSIGLDSSWAQKIWDGALAIEDITDEDLHNKIQEFQDWTSKAKECSDAILELQDNLADFAKQKFENAQQEYENLLSTIEHRMEMIEGSIEKIETQGYLVSTKMYDELAKSQQDSLGLLEKEYVSLQAELENAMASGDIVRYSDDWYYMLGQIQDVESEIQDMNIALIETNNTIRELEWEQFDRLQNMISRVHDESDTFLDLMSNDKMFNDDGSITNQGQASLGLHAVKYNTYLSQIKDYREELEELNAELAKDPNNTVLQDRANELEDSIWDLSSAVKDEEQAMKDLVSEGYDTFLNAMDSLIEKRKDLLQTTKDLYDYEKNVTQQTKEIANLEKQLQAYQGDTSESSRAITQQLNVKLQEARENLEETERKQYIEDQQKMLDDLRDHTEEWLNNRLDDLNLIIQGVID